MIERRVFLYSLDTIAKGGKKYNSPGKKDTTHYNNMKTNTINCKNLKAIKYSATATLT